MILRKFLIIFSLLLSASAFAADASLTAEADTAYSHGDYDKAFELYSKLADSKGASPELYFNMGNAAYKSGKNGLAVLYYLKAKRIDPSDSRVDGNLSFIRSYVDDVNNAELSGKGGNVSPDTPSLWDSVSGWVAVEHLSDTWALWAVVSFILFLAALASYFFSSNVIVKKIGFFGGIVCMAACGLFVAFALMAAEAYENDSRGVVIANKVTLYKSPDINSAAVGTPLHAGTEMSVLSQKTDGADKWVQVRLNSSTSGWLEDKDFAMVAR